jgi:hypothetical protein
MSQPKPWVLAGPPQPTSLGLQLALGATIAMGGAVVVGVFGGLTTIQSTYVAILLGWLVGLVIRRTGARYDAAAAAGLLSLAGSALASVISGVIIIVRQTCAVGDRARTHFHGDLATAARHWLVRIRVLGAVGDRRLGHGPEARAEAHSARVRSVANFRRSSSWRRGSAWRCVTAHLAGEPDPELHPSRAAYGGRRVADALTGSGSDVPRSSR